MSCDICIYQTEYFTNGDVHLKYIDCIRSYDFLDYLPIECNTNNGFFEIPGSMLLESITSAKKDNVCLLFKKSAIREDEDYMVSVSY